MNTETTSEKTLSAFELATLAAPFAAAGKDDFSAIRSAERLWLAAADYQRKQDVVKARLARVESVKLPLDFYGLLKLFMPGQKSNERLALLKRYLLNTAHNHPLSSPADKAKTMDDIEADLPAIKKRVYESREIIEQHLRQFEAWYEKHKTDVRRTAGTAGANAAIKQRTKTKRKKRF